MDYQDKATLQSFRKEMLETWVRAGMPLDEAQALFQEMFNFVRQHPGGNMMSDEDYERWQQRQFNNTYDGE